MTNASAICLVVQSNHESIRQVKQFLLSHVPAAQKAKLTALLNDKETPLGLVINVCAPLIRSLINESLY